MKKFTKVLALACAGLMLVGCGISQSTADKITAAAKTEDKKDDWTYDKCVKQLGKPTIDGYSATLKSGICQWVVGCKDQEALSKKLEANKELNALTVEFLFGTAVSAQFGTYNAKK